MNWICEGCEYIVSTPYICIWGCPKDEGRKNDRRSQAGYNTTDINDNR